MVLGLVYRSLAFVSRVWYVYFIRESVSSLYHCSSSIMTSFVSRVWCVESLLKTNKHMHTHMPTHTYIHVRVLSPFTSVLSLIMASVYSPFSSTPQTRSAQTKSRICSILSNLILPSHLHVRSFRRVLSYRLHSLVTDM